MLALDEIERLTSRPAHLSLAKDPVPGCVSRRVRLEHPDQI